MTLAPARTACAGFFVVGGPGAGLARGGRNNTLRGNVSAAGTIALIETLLPPEEQAEVIASVEKKAAATPDFRRMDLRGKRARFPRMIQT